ncbi:solute carrier family 40 member 1-like isoform X1 [Primulina huaijiensis]|uniref:solute carrier family 40 member 1-like isoform X1 n=1 Tax=Primulina huaijiensis TaxID=1492673 RepID=UPI003CC716A2
MMNELLLRVEEEQQPLSFPSSLLIYLYVGHFLARWGARMWEFSVGLYMINVWPDSLLLAAVYGAVESASTALFGPLLGQWVDKLSYIQVLHLWLLSQNLSFMVAGGGVLAILVYTGSMSLNFTAFISLVVLINIFGAVGVLSTLAGTILIEREWVVVISEGQSPDVLTKMNSIIRRIDLVCKLFAPVVSGFIISFVSLTASALTMALWNVLSVLLQYWLLISVYKGMPALKEISERKVSRSLVREVDEVDFEQPESSTRGTIIDSFSNTPYIRAWKVYIQQEVALPGLALALLYFTVLRLSTFLITKGSLFFVLVSFLTYKQNGANSFGSLMTATLEWEGIPTYVIGLARGISATVGIAATFLYPELQSHISTLRTGLWSIWSQWTCLLLCVASVFISNKTVAAYMLMSGVAASRLGLWMFDLSVIQQMQDHVAEMDRCVVGGVQNSLQSILDLMTYAMGIIISNPQDFWKLIMISFTLVTLAAVVYSLHIYRVRKHLIHFEKLLVLVELSTRSS